MVQTTALPTFLVPETDILPDVSSSLATLRKELKLETARQAQQIKEHTPDLSIMRTQNPQWVERAQRLRYQNFFSHLKECLPEGHPEAVDQDEFDSYCEHLLVVDQNKQENGHAKVVGTYRLRVLDLQECRENNISLYTATEFNLDKLMSNNGKVLELGRSCVHPDYRSGDVIRNLWSGLGEFIATNTIDYVIGCVSFPGADATLHKSSLAYLYQNHMMDESIRTEALDSVKAEIAALPVIPKDQYKTIFRHLPALLKAYIRMGGRVGEGAVLDIECDTLDLCVIANCKDLDSRYSKRFIKR